MKKIIISRFLFAAFLGAGTIAFSQDDAPKPPPPPPAPEGGRPDPGSAMLERLDADKDGKVSKDEFLAHSKGEAEKRFDQVDGNNDGVIEKSEFEEAARRMREARDQGRGPRDGDRPGGFRRPDRQDGDEGPGRRGPGDEGERGSRRGFGGGGMLRSMDANEDGEITKDEFIANSTERFEQLDANKDGKVTEEEMMEAGRRFRGDGERGPRGDGERRPRGDDAEKPAPPAEPKTEPAPAPPEAPAN